MMRRRISPVGGVLRHLWALLGSNVLSTERSYYDWKARGKRARDEPPPTLELTRQGLIDLLVEADVTYPARANKTVLLRLLTLHRQGAYLEFLEAVKRAGAIRTLESLARIELASQGGALLERVTTSRTSKSGVVTTTVRERWTPPDWHADGWFLERRHPADWSRRTLHSLPDHEQAVEADPLVGGCMTSCGWRGWLGRNGRANLSRPVGLAASLPPLLMASKASEVQL